MPINCSLFLIERVVVDWHGCHTALHFCVKANENKDKFLRCTGYLNAIKKPIKQVLLLILVHVSKLLASCLTAVKNMLSSTVKKYMRDPVKSILVY